MAERPTAADVIIPDPAREFLATLGTDKHDKFSGWLSSDLKRRSGSRIHRVGLFVVRPIAANTLVGIKTEPVVDEEYVIEHAEEIDGRHQQIGPDRFLIGELLGYNHKCYNPTARIMTSELFQAALLITRRALKKGDEITTDYSVTFDSATQRIDPCNCHSTHCRGVVDPTTDWRDPAFQVRYEGEFPGYMQTKIDQLKAVGGVELPAAREAI